MGIREFRESFTSIAREATEPIIITNHGKVVGWFTPAKRPPETVQDVLKRLDAVRKRAEARGIDVGRRMKEAGLEDDALFDDPWTEARPKAPKRK